MCNVWVWVGTKNQRQVQGKQVWAQNIKYWYRYDIGIVIGIGIGICI